MKYRYLLSLLIIFLILNEYNCNKLSLNPILNEILNDVWSHRNDINLTKGEQFLFDKFYVIWTGDGDRQSPINIPIDQVIQNSRELTNCNVSIFNFNIEPESVTLHNDGHTVKFQFKWHKEIPLIHIQNNTYQFCDLHVHWGQQGKGSEHSINNRRFSAEYHLVFYNTQYDGFKTARSKEKGLVVLALIATLQSDSLTNYLPTYINMIARADSSLLLPMQSISFNRLFGHADSILKNYFTYEGSLTTSPYYETVTWILSDYYVGITKNELQAYRELENDNGDEILSNVRIVQDLNERSIFYCS